MKCFISILTILLSVLSTTVQSSLFAPSPYNGMKPEIKCLATAIYWESRGEPFLGQVAVAHVVLNRRNDLKFPKTICKVVYQKHQFTDIDKARPDFSSFQWNSAVEIATVTYNGFDEDPTNGALYYYAHLKVSEPKWAKTKRLCARIHNHTFLGEL